MKRVIGSGQAPRPMGAYSQGWRAGDFVFVAGQGPLDPHMNTVVSESFREQVECTLKNIELVLAAEGATLADVVKFGVFLKSMDDFAELNEVFQAILPEPLPARTTVQADLRGILVEIDAVAYVGP